VTSAAPSREPTATRRRTRAAILAAAVALMRRSEVPTAQGVAAEADVSRRTVYQYFPTQEQLLTDAALEGVRGAVEEALALADGDDLEARIDTLVAATLRSCLEQEVLLRTMTRLTIEQRLAEGRGGPPAEAPLRGVRRIAWIESALAPVREQLGEARYERLVSALAVAVGFEALLVLRDIRGLEGEELTAVSRWMAHTLVQASLAEATAEGVSLSPMDAASPR
jgi:AcrR family transcriptional regulator